MFAERTNWSLAGNRLSEALSRHHATGKTLLDLTASNPTECGFRYNREALLKALANPAALIYQPQPQGLEIARQAVANYYGERGTEVAIEELVLTTSTSEAYSFLFRLLCNPGDEVLIPSPSYPLFDFLADLQDVKLVRYPLVYDYGWQIDFGAFERGITPRTRAAILVHPNNPTGHFCSPQEAGKLNEMCATHPIALLVDEVFLDFALDGAVRQSFCADRDVLTFTISGISKISGLPQMKFAWVAVSGPAALKAQALARIEVIADTFLSMNAPVQHAACALLDQRKEFQPQLMDRVRENLAELDRQLARQESCSRLKIQGGWYAVIRVPQTRSEEDLAIDLLTRAGVYVHPGHFYDFPNGGYVVVSLITPPADFATGIQGLLCLAGERL